MSVFNIIVGALLGGAIAALAWRAHALTRDGALAAFIVGTLTYASGTIGFTLVLLAFFVPSVLLSRLGKARKRKLVDIGKAGARDAIQVIANGGVATLSAVGWALTHDVSWAACFAGAYAAATADTWGTEIGTLANHPPRSILTSEPVAPGMSGGVTLPGSLAETAGAVWLGVAGLVGIAIAYVQLRGGFPIEWQFGGFVRMLLAIAIGGIVGALVDSILGATLQELRYCDSCARSCETNPHVCGNATRLIRGVRGFSNDIVNLLATAAGALVAAAIVYFYR